MPGSVTSVFSEPDDFEAALRKEGALGLLVTGRGQFRARLTQITLHRLRLSDGEEQLSRIAVVAVPRDLVLISFPIGTAPSPIWNGVGFQAGEIMIIGPNQKVYARTDGPCRWGAIWLPVEDLIQDGRAVTGGPFAIPSVARFWRPRPVVRAHLGELYTAAVRIAQTRPQLLADAERAHGLEQQLIHALIKALAAGSAARGTPTQSRYQDILGRFEDLLNAQPNRSLRMAEICAALNVSDRLLRSIMLGAFGHGSERLHSSAANVLGASRFGPQREWRRERIGDRAALRLPRGGRFRRPLSCSYSGNPLPRLWRMACECGQAAWGDASVVVPCEDFATVAIDQSPSEMVRYRTGSRACTSKGTRCRRALFGHSPTPTITRQQSARPEPSSRSLARGRFAAKIIRIDLHDLWMQRFSDNLPRVGHSANFRDAP